MKIELLPWGLILLGSTLAVGSVLDILQRRVSIRVLVISGLVALGFAFLRTDSQVADMLLGAALGLVYVFISLASRGAIGIGDAMYLIISGVYLGLMGNLSLLVIASFGAGIAGLVALLIFKKDRKYELPFIPFLLMGVVLYGVSAYVYR